jgi:hypothetical protein
MLQTQQLDQLIIQFLFLVLVLMQLQELEHHLLHSNLMQQLENLLLLDN